MKFLSFVMFLLISLWIYDASGEMESRKNAQLDGVARSDVMGSLNIPLHFIANQGQMNEAVAYYARSNGANVYCTDYGLTFGFAEGNISLKLLGSQRVRPQGSIELGGKINYFIGNDPARWRTNIPTFKEVAYNNVYPGVDLVYRGDQSHLKYTFYIQPGTDPDCIRVLYDGIKSLRLDEATGGVIIETEWGEIRDAFPTAYQEIDGLRKDVNVSFYMSDPESVGFILGNYDKNYALVIDPVFEIRYSTYLGGTNLDTGNSIAVNGSGVVYITGSTWSTDFPKRKPIQGNFGGGVGDAFVACMDTRKSGDASLIFSTYIGGSGDDSGNGISLDSLGNVYIVGTTYSDDFPIQNVLQGVPNKDGTIFAIKLNNNGTIGYSSSIGGSDGEMYSGNDIAIDLLNNAYIAGDVSFPSSEPGSIIHAVSGTPGDRDVYAAKISSNGKTLMYSNNIGGSAGETGYGIAVDSAGNGYITGQTYSTDFPKVNPLPNIPGGNGDAFILKIGPTMPGVGSILYSTLLGGSNYDSADSIALDSSGNMLVTGDSNSLTDFPLKNPVPGTPGSADPDAFVTKISSDGKNLIYSTFLGGNENDVGRGIAVDRLDNAYISGYTWSSDFPTKDPIQGRNLKYPNYPDSFVTELSKTGALVFSTYFGGERGETALDIDVDIRRNVYITGSTTSPDLATGNAYQTEKPGTAPGDYWTAAAFVTWIHQLLPPGEIVIGAYSPVDIEVTDPEGRKISKNSSTIPNAVYTQADLNGDGDLDDIVDIPDVQTGGYLIQVTPEPGALLDDTYTLSIAYNGRMTTLAEDIQIQDIPLEPYKFFIYNWAIEEGWSYLTIPGNTCYYIGDPPMNQPDCVALVDVVDLGFDSLAKWFTSILKPNNPVNVPWRLVIGPDGAMDSSLPDVFNSLKYISPESGYWVKIVEGTGGVNLSLGSIPFDISCPIPLSEGWTPVGYPSEVGYHDTPLPPNVPGVTDWVKVSAPVAKYVFASIDGMYDMIIGQSGAYDPALPPAFSSLHYVVPYDAFWIKMNQSANLLYSQAGSGGPFVLAPTGKSIKSSLVMPTRTSMMIYGRIAGIPAGKGAQVQVFGQTGMLYGESKIAHDGYYGIMMVYGDDADTPQIDGAVVGEKLTLYINGQPAETENEIYWLGDRVIQQVNAIFRDNRRPQISMLGQNYPNPFNPETWIPYQLKKDSDVVIQIYSSTGQLLRKLNLGHRQAGFYFSKDTSAYWDGKNESGEQVVSGIYFYTLQAEGFADTKKMMLLR